MDIFRDFSDTSRVWIFGLKNELEPEAESLLRGKLQGFVENWLSHKKEVRGAFEIIYSRFIFFVADNDLTHVSGCSIDSVFRAVREACAEQELSLASALDIFYRDSSGKIELANLGKLKEAYNTGELLKESIVFQNAAQTLAEVRVGNWEVSLANSKLKL